MKLVGKINIEVWDGDPNDPNSKLKQEIEEYNDIHPDFASLWDKDSYIEELLNDNGSNQRTHPISGKKGKVLFPGEYGWNSHLDCRIGLGDDSELLLQKHVAGKSKEVTKKLSANGVNYAGYCESLELISIYGDRNKWGRDYWIEPGDFKSEDFPENYRILIANLNETVNNSVLLPLPDNYPIKLFTKTNIKATLNPTGLAGSMKSISIVICGRSGSTESYISPLKKDIPKPLTLHKFSTPISFKETDYISVSYNVTFITEFRVEGIKEVSFKDKEGNYIKGVRFPAIFGMHRKNKSSKLQWVDSEAPREPCSIGDPWRSTNPAEILNMFSGITFTPPVSLTIAGDPNETISYDQCKKAFSNIAETSVYEEYDNVHFHEFITKHYLKNPLKETALLPLVHRNTGRFYSYINKVDSSAIDGNRQKVSLKFKITEPPKITVKLPATDVAEMNIPYYMISETVCGTPNGSYINAASETADVVYFTVFETPMDKSKYDEIVLSINQFMEGIPGLCPEISSKTTEG